MFPKFLVAICSSSCSTCDGCLARRGTWSGTGLLLYLLWAICERFLQRLHFFRFYLIKTWKSKVSFPLTTRGKHIVDSKGHVVRLRCVNWHLASQDIFADLVQRNRKNRNLIFFKCRCQLKKTKYAFINVNNLLSIIPRSMSWTLTRFFCWNFVGRHPSFIMVALPSCFPSTLNTKGMARTCRTRW